jgi:transposase
MWLFRKRPEDLTPDQQAELEQLFEQIPDLELIHSFRWGITDIFDTAKDRVDAARQFSEFRALLDPEEEDHQELLKFFETYDAHQKGILAYFDERKTSGPVEGLNNKARVITKRCYGLKDTGTLWTRLCLDINLATLAMGLSVSHVHALANTIRDVFLGYYT